MKKFLLPVSLLLLGAASANAQEFADFFKVEYAGTTYAPGETIVVNETEVNADDPSLVNYMPHIKIVNLTDEPRSIKIAVNYTGTPSAADINDDNTAGYGFPSLCYSGAYPTDGNGADNCLATGKNMVGECNTTVPEAGIDTFQIDYHLEEVDPTLVSTYAISLTVLDSLPEAIIAGQSPWEYVQELTDPVTFYLKLGSAENTGVENVAVNENTPKEYFDLQGRKVANPEKGLYILRQGSNVKKVVIL